MGLPGISGIVSHHRRTVLPAPIPFHLVSLTTKLLSVRNVHYVHTYIRLNLTFDIIQHRSREKMYQARSPSAFISGGSKVIHGTIAWKEGMKLPPTSDDRSHVPKRHSIQRLDSDTASNISL